MQGRDRDVDVLLIDDIQFPESEERAQEDFFHTVDELWAADKQIVISSGHPPTQIGHLEERLRTRFEWGLITDIQPPDLETRLAILREKSAREGLLVPADVRELIAGRIRSNIRELEGALSQVVARAGLEHTEITVALAQRVLDDLYPDADAADTHPIHDRSGVRIDDTN